jgi:hypothetical protein
LNSSADGFVFKEQQRVQFEQLLLQYIQRGSRRNRELGEFFSPFVGWTEPRWDGLGWAALLAAGKKKNCRSRCGEGEALALLLAVAQGVSHGYTAGPTDSRKSAAATAACRSLRCKKARKDSLLVTIVFPTYTFRQPLQTSDPLALTELFSSADNTRRSLQCLRRLLIFFRPPHPERLAALPALPASPISTSHPHQHT